MKHIVSAVPHRQLCHRQLIGNTDLVKVMGLITRAIQACKVHVPIQVTDKSKPGSFSFYIRMTFKTTTFILNVLRVMEL